MSPFRPDIVDCWMYRVPTTARAVERPELLLLRRAPGRILAGLWQCVSGLDRAGRAGRRRPPSASWPRRPASDRDAIEAFYDLDLVNQFH